MSRDRGPVQRGADLRVLIAGDKFKGSLAADEVCRAIADGVRRAAPEADIDMCPMADGGEGTADTLATMGGQIVELDVCGPLPGTRVTGRITLLDDGVTALLDMSSAAGFSLLDQASRDPTRTTSFGVGELIRHAVELDRQHIIVGLGGSATCDGGFGAAQALGLHVRLDGESVLEADAPLTGGDLSRVTHVDLPILRPRALITCLCDVDNPLFGPIGAAHIYAPQKGASPQQVRELDDGLRNIATVCERLEFSKEPGMGAAGGLAFGLSMTMRTELRSGAEACADACRLSERLDGAQLCLTGEGRFDAQSYRGKVVAGVAKRCAEADVPCVVLTGGIADDTMSRELPKGVSAVFSTAPGPGDLQELMKNAETNVAATAEQVTRLLLAYGDIASLRRERAAIDGTP